MVLVEMGIHPESEAGKAYLNSLKEKHEHEVELTSGMYYICDPTCIEDSEWIEEAGGPVARLRVHDGSYLIRGNTAAVLSSIDDYVEVDGGTLAIFCGMPVNFAHCHLYGTIIRLEDDATLIVDGYHIYLED